MAGRCTCVLLDGAGSAQARLRPDHAPGWSKGADQNAMPYPCRR